MNGREGTGRTYRLVPEAVHTAGEVCCGAKLCGDCGRVVAVVLEVRHHGVLLIVTGVAVPVGTRRTARVTTCYLFVNCARVLMMVMVMVMLMMMITVLLLPCCL